MPSDAIVQEAISAAALTWLAVVTSMVALGKQAYDIIRNRRRERRVLDEALDRQPLVREQLQLGNVGAAVEQLTAIIDQMAKAKQRDDIAATNRISFLEKEVREVEQEAENWEARYHKTNEDWERRHKAAMEDYERRYNALDERCRKITAVLRRHNWDIDDV